MISAHSPWQPDDIVRQASLPVTQLLQLFELDQLTTFPAAAQLNRLVKSHYGHRWPGPAFVDQGDLDKMENRYYEAIIAQDNRVPTREQSYHDLFNALIWLQFPRTKGMLNRLHMADIDAFGAHPRTPRRNRVTHFDECGVVLAVPADKLERGNTLLGLLDSHCWQDALLDARAAWRDVIHPIIFGHANLEMMLSPFIGLTGKWLAVVVPEEFATCDPMTQSHMVDTALEQRIHALGEFEQGAVLKPLPLLGVPGWAEGQTRMFYANTDYFRPRRASVPPTVQLPLTDKR